MPLPSCLHLLGSFSPSLSFKVAPVYKAEFSVHPATPCRAWELRSEVSAGSSGWFFAFSLLCFRNHGSTCFPLPSAFSSLKYWLLQVFSVGQFGGREFFWLVYNTEHFSFSFNYGRKICWVHYCKLVYPWSFRPWSTLVQTLLPFTISIEKLVVVLIDFFSFTCSFHS